MPERLKKLNIILDASGLSGASFSALITAFTILLRNDENITYKFQFGN